MIRILISDNLSNRGLDALRAHKHVEVDYQPGLSEEQLAKAIVGADGLIIRSGSQVSARVIEAADKLRVVGRAGIGVDNIDIAAASMRGIAVMNTPTGNSVTTAEHTIGLMMSLARWIPRATMSLKAGKWEKKKLQGRELAGKTLAVIGLGTIGRIVADRARGLHMRTIGFDPVLTAERAAAFGVELLPLEKIWQQADVITVHTPLNNKTRNLIDAEVVPKLKQGVLLINCARGGIYNEEAVLKGLEDDHIGGAAFDVFTTEPPKDMPLLQHERVVCTPHLGASTREAQERVAVEISEQVVAYLTSGAVVNALNVPSMSPEQVKQVGPYVALATQLGRFLAQAESLVPKTIEIECIGEALNRGVDNVASAALAGFLEHFLDAPVNAISASHLAADRGITVRELATRKVAGPHGTAVAVRIYDADGKVGVAVGALGADDSPRLVRWNDFNIEAQLAGSALLVASADVPGVIGFMGTVLGDAGVNVAAVSLGKADAGNALSLWNLDDAVSDELLAKVNASEQVIQAAVIQL